MKAIVLTCLFLYSLCGVVKSDVMAAWSPVDGPAVTYKVFWQLSDSPPRIIDAGTNLTAVLDTQKGGSYSCYVIAYSSVLFLESEPSNVVFFVGPNNPPIALNRVLICRKNTSCLVALSGYDKDQDVLTYKIKTSVANGKITGTPPYFTYTPNRGFSGEDFLTYTVFDGLKESAPARVTIYVKN